jgi:hypothetical protein
MKHDELCKKLEGLWHDSYKAPGYQALRAVVELHKPITHRGYEDEGLFCNNCEFDYPCPTIQDIEKELM